VPATQAAAALGDVGPGVHGDERSTHRRSDVDGEQCGGVPGRGSVDAHNDRTVAGRSHPRRGAPHHRDRARHGPGQRERDGAGEHPGPGTVTVAAQHQHPGAVGPIGEQLDGAAWHDLDAARAGTGVLGPIGQLSQPGGLCLLRGCLPGHGVQQV
jgi:hypothetical protein